MRRVERRGQRQNRRQLVAERQQLGYGRLALVAALVRRGRLLVARHSQVRPLEELLVR